MSHSEIWSRWKTRSWDSEADPLWGRCMIANRETGLTSQFRPGDVSIRFYHPIGMPIRNPPRVLTIGVKMMAKILNPVKLLRNIRPSRIMGPLD